MEPLTKIQQDAADFLRKTLGADVRIVEEFSRHDHPPAQDCISVGLDAVELCGRQAKIVLRFDLLSRSGVGCRRLFDRLCSALVCQKQPICVSKMTCGEVAHEELLDGEVLTAKAQMCGILTDAQDADGAAIRDVIFQAKGVDFL